MYYFGAEPSVTTREECLALCQKAKESAYEACRKIPVEDRVGRDTCFRKADQALTDCERACGKTGTGAVVLIGVVLLALWAA